MVAPTRSQLTTSVVVMGVSGCGKTAVARAAAERLGWPYQEGDELHPPANVAKMAAGQALDDDDRWPWLRAIAAWVGGRERAGRDAILTCSALKRSYRDLLRKGHPSVWFAHLDVRPEVLRVRLETRRGHFMPASLLDSQLATLQALQPDEPGTTLAADGPLDDVLERLLHILPGRPGAGKPHPGGSS